MEAATAQKSPEAFRTISEVAAELDVPQHVLRFWETKFPQVKPLKRAGGRRYYRPEDVYLLRGIRSLLYSDGLTIKGVQKLLHEQGVRYVAEFGRKQISLMREAAPVVGHGSNVHPFPRAAAAVDVTPAQRERLEALLTELVELKGRLHAAKRS
ncbi:MAG: MerR family transcriptional regulator [Alphaproteobacteria bacterium]